MDLPERAGTTAHPAKVRELVVQLAGRTRGGLLMDLGERASSFKFLLRDRDSKFTGPVPRRRVPSPAGSARVILRGWKLLNPARALTEAGAVQALPVALTLTGNARGRKYDTDLGNRLALPGPPAWCSI
jgi:hypothetical protein